MGTGEDWVEREFINLAQTKEYKVTSNPTEDYNCIAWSANVTDEWWWPEPDATWPKGLPRENTLTNFIAAFNLLGYESCENFDLEDGFEKVAVYVGPDDLPTHMARQLDDGTWTSKLGNGWDINHYKLDGVAGRPGYGRVVHCMKRSKTHNNE